MLVGKIRTSVRSSVFRFVSLVWGSLNRVVRMLARWKLVPQQHLPVKVVSIGNLEAGGTGKSPLVADLARFAHSRGKRVAILTRGYGGRIARSGESKVVAPFNPGEASLDPAEWGDEVVLLHALAPHAWIGVGAKRAHSFAAIVEPIDLAILDDGLQQFGLHRDVEVIAVTSRPEGEAVFREGVHAHDALQSAFWVWTKGEREPRDWSGLPDAQRYRVQWTYEFQPARAAQRYLLMTSVAHPLEVRKGLEAAGVSIARHVALKDHAPLSAERIAAVHAEAAGLPILMTGKDAVKWKHASRVPITVVERSPVDTGALWSRVLEKLEVE